MKRTQRIELNRNIRKTFVSFFSITMFVALSVAIFTGISWSADACLRNTEETLDEGNFHDIEVFYPYGYSDEDVEEFLTIDGIDQAEGCRYVYEFLESDENYNQVILLQRTNIIDTALDVEGTMPEAENEIAVSHHWAETNGYTIGDTVTFVDSKEAEAQALTSIMNYDEETDSLEDLNMDGDDEDAVSYLNTNEFTITALVTSPCYLDDFASAYGVAYTNLLPLTSFMIVSEEAWNPETNSGYNYVLLRSESLRQYDYMTTEYKHAVMELENEVGDLAATLSDSKNNKIQETTDSIMEDLDTELSDAKAQLEDAAKQIEDGSMEIEDAEKQVQEAEETIEAGEEEIATAKTQIAQKKQELAAAKVQIDSAKSQISSAENELSAAEQEYKVNKTKYDDISNAYNKTQNVYNTAITMANNGSSADEISTYITNSGIETTLNNISSKYPDDVSDYSSTMDSILSQVQSGDITGAQSSFESMMSEFEASLSEAQAELSTASTQIQQATAKLETAKSQLSASEAEYNSAAAAITEAEAQITASENEIEESKVELEEAKKVIEGQKTDLDDAKDELAKGEDEYEEGELERENIEQKTELLQDYGIRTSIAYNNVSTTVIRVLGEMCHKIRYSMALLFLLIGILVCYSAVSRLVNDQTKLIGTKKALGLDDRSILMGYLGYAGRAVVIGCVIGVLVGWQIVERVLLEGLLEASAVTKRTLYTEPLLAVIVCVIIIVFILLVAYFAVNKNLKMDTVDLISGNIQRQAKTRKFEKTRAWNRLSLFGKTIVNNALNDRRRVFGTLVGIIGCTSLIVMAITLNDNILNSFDEEFSEYCFYDTEVYFDNEVETASEEIRQVIEECGGVCTEIMETQVLENAPDGNEYMANMIIPSDLDEFKEFTSRVPWTNSEGDPYEGFWVCNSYCSYYDLNPGDDYNFTEMDGEAHTVSITGSYVMYTTLHQFLVDKDTYTEIFGEEAKGNAYIIDTTNCDVTTIQRKLKDVDGYLYTTDFYAYCEEDFEAFKNLSIALFTVFISLSVAMALLVLLNLMTMFINEKKKELIILMINGYSLGDAKRYIYSDTILMTIIGVIGGLILGTAVGNFVVGTMESQATIFLHGTDIAAILIGTIGTIVLTFIISIIALGRINKFDLSDINEI